MATATLSAAFVQHALVVARESVDADDTAAARCWIRAALAELERVPPPAREIAPWLEVSATVDASLFGRALAMYLRLSAPSRARGGMS